MRRVAVTGMGVISPVGEGRDAFFASLVQSRSGVRRLDFDRPDRHRVRLGADVRDFDPTRHFARDRLPQLDRYSQFALVAAREAWTEARLRGVACDACGVYLGTGMGGAATVEAGYDDLFAKQLGRVKPYSVIAAMPHAAAANVALDLAITGPALTYSVACASSAVAIGEAYRAIGAGHLDVALAGGAEALLVYGVMRSWEALMTLATACGGALESSCRPFASDRSGFVLGEGGAALVLEELAHARRRGAPLLGEIVGYGISNDAGHLTRPDPHGQARAMRAALGDGAAHGTRMEDIGYVNAHGTATRAGDRAETEALKMVFGTRAAQLAVSSTKALHGHLMGAAGAAELIVALMALERRIAPPTAHLYTRDPECDLDYVPLAPRAMPDVDAAMSSSFAFGGTNAVLIVRRPREEARA